MLLGHQSDPGGKVASRAKRLPVADLGDQRGGHNRTNARDLLEPAAVFTGAVPCLNAVVDNADLSGDGPVLPSKKIEAKPRHRRDAVILVIGNYVPKFGR